MLSSFCAWSRSPPVRFWIVEPSGEPRTHIQPTIDAAADGDLVLARSGEY
jgi:hypothetical protein